MRTRRDGRARDVGRRVARGATLLAGCAAALITGASRAGAHPLHTTFTDVRHDPSAGTVQLSIRVFAEDVRAAAARQAQGRRDWAGLAPDSALARYARSRVRLVRRDGTLAALIWGGVRDEGETLVITLRATGIRALADVRIGNALLLETFADQVNIVRVAEGGRRGSTLFTARDPAALRALAG